MNRSADEARGEAAAQRVRDSIARLKSDADRALAAAVAMSIRGVAPRRSVHGLRLYLIGLSKRGGLLERELRELSHNASAQLLMALAKGPYAAIAEADRELRAAGCANVYSARDTLALRARLLASVAIDLARSTAGRARALVRSRRGG